MNEPLLSTFATNVQARESLLQTLKEAAPKLANSARMLDGEALPAYLKGLHDAQSFESYNIVDGWDVVNLTVCEANNSFASQVAAPKRLRDAISVLSDDLGRLANEIPDAHVIDYARGLQDGNAHCSEELSNALNSIKGTIDEYAKAIAAQVRFT